MNRVDLRWAVIAWIFAVTLGWLCSVEARAEDWPQWRGPNRDGVYRETGLFETFPPEGLKQRWRVPVGWGFSSPVIANGRVFISDSQLNRPVVQERVLCFDEATGKQLWMYCHEANYPEWAFAPGQEPGPNATPVVADGKVYAPGPLGHRLFCLEAGTGALLWDTDLAEKYQIEVTAAISASPLIEGKLLILLIGGKPDACVVVLDKDSGQEVWKSLDESAAHSSPIVVTAGAHRQLIVWTLQSVTGLNPATGIAYWREKFNAGGSSSVVSTPVFSGNRLLVNGLMLRLDAETPGVSLLWPTRPQQRFLASTSTGLLLGDYLYCGEKSGLLVCRDANTGEQVWQTDKVTDSQYEATTSIHMTANGDSALLFNDRGELIRARLTPEGYHEISRVPLIEPTYSSSGRKVVWAAPAYANRHVFARNEKELICASLGESN